MKTSQKCGRKRCAACGKFAGNKSRRRGGRYCCDDPRCLRKLKIEIDQEYRRDNPDAFIGRYGYIKERRARQKKMIQVKSDSAKTVDTASAGNGVWFGAQNGVIQVISSRKMRVKRLFPGDGDSSMPSFARYKYELPVNMP